MPKRLKRSRKKGWRKPENSVIVDRTSRLGNPFKIIGDMIYADASHRRTVNDKWVYYEGPYESEYLLHHYAVKNYEYWILGTKDFENVVRPCKFTVEDIRQQLAGKDLVCFCGLDMPCHGDVLLDIANN